MTTTLASSSAPPFTFQIECHHCHAKGHIDSYYPQCTLVIDCVDDSLFEDTDELLVMADYDEDPSVMYKKDFPFDEDHLCLLYTSPSPRDRQKSRMPSSA